MVNDDAKMHTRLPAANAGMNELKDYVDELGALPAVKRSCVLTKNWSHWPSRLAVKAKEGGTPNGELERHRNIFLAIYLVKLIDLSDLWNKIPDEVNQIK
jgi:hypothetical protein